MVEADSHGVFDHMDHAWLWERLRWRLEDRAFLGLLRKWLQAGILETAGRVIPPDPGVPQGGVVSPVCAHVDGHDALDRWVAQVVTRQCRGEAWLSRAADELGCACRFRRDAAWVYPALPTRRGKVTLAVAPAKPRSLRCSRGHPGMTRRCTCVGVACFWTEARQGVPRGTRRTARTTWPRACHRRKDWIQANRPVPGQAFFSGLKARWRGHSSDDGGHGNSHALHRVLDWAMQCALTWLKRRGGTRRRFSWQRVTQRRDAVPIERPRLTERSRRSGSACAPAWRGRASNRSTGCGTTARPGRCGGRRVTGVPTAEATKRRQNTTKGDITSCQLH